ncbi:MAG: type I 3-dehydroquinate dehydratase, partial [Planctomycetes bacterium]|nr:type I 3-dehydroquinate dehydratase [Planctomycetota bacterium]
MICISVTPTSRKLAKVDILNASRRCDLVEVCLDHLVKEPNVGDMISGFDKPILVSCRRPQDGGHWKGSEEQRLQLLRQAIVAGPEYVELDFDIAGGIPRFGKTKRVISFTSYKPLGNVDDVFKQAAGLKADVVKFTWPTPTLDAAWPLLAAVTKKRELPVVGMGVGAASTTFSLLGQKFGSPWVYAALEKGMEAHDGQATVWDLNDIYDSPGIDSKTRLIAVVGGSAPPEDGVAPQAPAEPAVLAAAQRLQRLTVQALNAGFKAIGQNIRCLPLELGRLEKLGQMLDILKINALIVSPQWSEKLLEVAGKPEEAAIKSHYADLLLKQPDGWHTYNFIWRNALKALETSLASKGGTPPRPPRGKGGGGGVAHKPLHRRNVLRHGGNNIPQALAGGNNPRQGVRSVTRPTAAEAPRLGKMFDGR